MSGDIHVPDIPSLIDDMNRRERGDRWPVRNIWASRIGHPCARRLVYDQILWEQQEMPSDGLLRIFVTGERVGKGQVRDLEDALEVIDVRVDQQEVRIPDNPERISGKIDCVLGFKNPEGGRRIGIPCELKSMSPYAFDGIRSINDMLNHPKPYMRAYPVQLMVYIDAFQAPFGIFMLRNKSSGEDRMLVMDHDPEMVANFKARAQTVNQSADAIRTAKESGAPWEDLLPDRIEYRSTICGDCPWMKQCLPELFELGNVEDHLGDAEVDELLSTLETNREAHQAFAAAERKVAGFCKNAGAMLEPGKEVTLVFPRFNLVLKKQKRTQYDIPDEVKSKYAVETFSIRKTVEPMDTPKGESDDESPTG